MIRQFLEIHRETGRDIKEFLPTDWTFKHILLIIMAQKCK